MNKVFPLITLLTIPLFLFAQTQQGYVKTKGRLGSNGTVIAGTRLPGATVTVKGGNAVVSGNKGTFSLAIPNNNYYLQNVQKQGYVLTDPDVLSKQYVYSKNPLVLVLETPEQQADDKLATEKKIRHTLRRQLQEKEDKIESLKEQQKLNDEEYRKQLQEIYAQQESNEKLISEMADRYSKMDFDEVDEFNRQISSLILEGKLTEADSLLSTKGDINSRAEALRQYHEANVKEGQELQRRQKKHEKSTEYERKEREDLAQDCFRKFEILKMLHQNDSAAYYIVFRAELDTLDIYAQNDAAHFLNEYMAQYKEAFVFYNRMLNVAEQKHGKNSSIAAMCNNNFGAFFLSLGQYNYAERHFSHALDTYRGLGDVFLPLVALIEGNLGSVYIDKQDYPSALSHFANGMDIYRSLYGDDCDEMANLYNSIGLCYSKQRKYDMAESYYQKVKDIWVRLYGEDSYDVSIVNNNLAGILWRNGQYDRAEKLYNDVLSFRRNIFGDNHPQVANIYNNLSALLLHKGSIDSAYVYQLRATEIWKEAYGERNPIVADSYGNISEILQQKGDWRGSLNYLKKAYDIALVTRGQESASTHDLMANIDYVMAHLLQESNNTDICDEHNKFMIDKVYTAFIPQIDSSPAARSGMSGEYYILEYENWNIGTQASMLLTNEQLKGKPKTLVFMQENNIHSHRFESTIGAQLYLKIVGKEKKVKMIEDYKKWKIEQSK